MIQESIAFSAKKFRYRLNINRGWFLTPSVVTCEGAGWFPSFAIPQFAQPIRWCAKFSLIFSLSSGPSFRERDHNRWFPTGGSD